MGVTLLGNRKQVNVGGEAGRQFLVVSQLVIKVVQEDRRVTALTTGYRWMEGWLSPAHQHIITNISLLAC